MTSLTDTSLERLVAQTYAKAYAHHGDLSLEIEAFSSHLDFIIEKRLGASALTDSALDLVKRLHTNDLYLAVACAQAGEVAWGRFSSVYDEPVRRICKCVCLSSNAARELAASVPGHLFLPDSTGRSRIASYEGISSLSTWLAVVIKHRAIREGRLKSNNLESLDRIADVADETSMLKIEAALRANKYNRPIRDSLRGAINLLSDRERLILRLRYERQLQVSQVARLLGVGPSAITRQLNRTREKLREGIISILSTGHRLGPAAVEECVADLLDNREHAIIARCGERCEVAAFALRCEDEMSGLPSSYHSDL